MADIQGSAAASPGAEQSTLSPVRRLRRSAGYAWSGLARAWREQPNFRLECYLGLAVTLLAGWLGTGLVAIVLSASLVLSLELVNSAIEKVVDIASPNRHPLAGAAKDLAAAAVLLAALGSLLVGLFALGPTLLERLGGII